MDDIVLEGATIQIQESDHTPRQHQHNKAGGEWQEECRKEISSWRVLTLGQSKRVRLLEVFYLAIPSRGLTHSSKVLRHTCSVRISNMTDSM